MTVFYERFRKVCPLCNTVASTCSGRCTAAARGEPENAMNVEKPYCLRKLSEVELLVRDSQQSE